MKKFTLIGCPLGHSMSPFIHKRLFALSGQEAEYSLTEIPADKLQASVEQLRTLCGFNITIPYKTDIIPHLAKLDETAERYHSVNTVFVGEDGALHGYNTDCTGFLRSVGEIPAGARLLLVGSGGVGRMMATECWLRGADLTIVERDLDRAHALAQELQARFPETGSTVRVLDAAPEDEQFDLLMNATPVGMYPKVDACPVSQRVIEHSTRVFDVIYNPTATRLVQTARELGKWAVGGSAMLVWQAVRAHEIWYGAQFALADIEALIREMEAEVDRQFAAKEAQA